MTKQPSYRFAGYTEPWEEKKLGEVSDRYDNLRVPVSANERVSGNIPYYGANGIQDYVDGYTHDGEFILIAEDGASDLKDYPVQYVNGKVWVNNHAHVIQGKKDLINNIFLLFAVKQINIEPFLVGGGRAKLNSDVMMKLPLQLPSLPEQTAIGSFFQNIDQLISLQQRKLEVLKEQKKTYLKLLFPAKGQTKPDLRFAGFEDEWKEVKLGEVTNRYDNLRVPVSANERISGDTPYYGANGIQDYVDGYTHDGEFILIAEDGASDLKDYPVQYVNGKVWVNNHAHVIQGKKDLINNIFLLFAVKQINIEPFLVGGGRAKLNSDIMMKLPLHLPPLPEQEAIGSFFQNLDKAIAKQEEKFNQLKESKQTLLRKMFI